MGWSLALAGLLGWAAALLAGPAYADPGVRGAWSAGYNHIGQLGLADTTNRGRFDEAYAGGLDVIAVAGGGFWSLALAATGEVYASGLNYDGQLGLGDTTDRTAFAPVPGLSGIVAVAGGLNHALALKDDGTVYVSGWNYYGQLGLGDTDDRSVFTQVPGVSGIAAVAAGSHHSLLLSGSGAVYSCGWNAYGQLGQDDTAARLTFAAVPGLSGATAIAAGGDHSLAVMADGSLYACGYNSNGQLGLGDTTDRQSFTRVTTLSNARSASAGGLFSLVRTSTGAVYSCGSNTYGQLGLGHTSDRSRFTATGVTNVAAVAAGYDHSVLVKLDGTVYACGRNYAGALAQGDTSNRASFTPVSDLVQAEAVAAALGHSLAVADPSSDKVTLYVQSTPVTGVPISGAFESATNFAARVYRDSAVVLTAPATVADGDATYAFARWTVDGSAQPDGQASVTVTASADTTASAEYVSTVTTHTLDVQSTPVTGVAIGCSSGGVTNYTLQVADDDVVCLAAPAAASQGGWNYAFLRWTLNGADQPEDLTTLVFTMEQDSTAVAEYAADTPGTGADIVLASIEPSDFTVGAGSPVTVTVSVADWGGAAAGAFLVALYDQSAGTSLLGLQAVGGLLPGQSTTVTFTGLLFDAPGNAMLLAFADAGGQTVESDETNNRALATVSVEAADLVASGFGPSSYTVGPNEAFNARVTVTNSSIAEVGAFVVGLYNQSAGATLLGLQPVDGLGPGESTDVTFTGVALADAGQVALLAFADAGAQIVESDEDNNRAVLTLTVELPDLVVSNFGPSQYDAGADTPINFGVTVTNAGGAQAGSFLVGLYALSDDATLLGAETVDGLVPGESAVVTFGSYFFSPAGDRTFLVWADAQAQIAESDEDNNRAALTLAFQAADLVASNFGPSQYSVGAGEPVNFGVTVTNASTATTGGFFVGLYALGSGATLLDVQPAGGLGPGESTVVIFPNLAFSALGDVTLLAWADAQDQIAESDEDNNRATVVISVQAATSTCEPQPMEGRDAPSAGSGEGRCASP